MDDAESAQLQILFPMGGLGTRFKAAGFATPKPLIAIDTQGATPMILKAIQSFDRLLSDPRLSTTLLFIVRAEHESEERLATRVVQALETHLQKYNLEVSHSGPHCGHEGNSASSGLQVKQRYFCRGQSEKEGQTTRQQRVIDVVTILLASDTRGAVETCLWAKSWLNPHAPLVIADCDLFFSSEPYEAHLWQMCRTAAKSFVAERNRETAARAGVPISPVAGLLVYFFSTATCYSYAELESQQSGVVVRTAEKVPISNHALIGSYAFGSAAVFLAAAEALVEKPLSEGSGPPEYYVSLLYNEIIQRRLGVVKAVQSEEYSSFGTPEELERYKAGERSHRVS